MHIDPNWFTSTSTCFVGESLKSHVFPDLKIQKIGTFDIDFEGPIKVMTISTCGIIVHGLLIHIFT